jgi:phytoene desaturase
LRKSRRWKTPETFRDDSSSYHGAAFGCAPRLTQSAWFRPHNRDPRIPGLYLAGAGTHPGAGVPGVVNSAKATVGLVLDDLRERLEARAPAHAMRDRAASVGAAFG